MTGEQERRGRAVRLVSRYAGRCRLCESAYRAGDEVRWRKGVGCMHAACGACIEECA